MPAETTVPELLSQPNVPGVFKDTRKVIRASAILTATPVYSDIVDVSANRKLSVEITLNGASAANELCLQPVGSSVADQPGAGDDSWFCFDERDISPTAADAPAVASGADYTVAPAWNRVVIAPLEIRTKPTTGVTDKIRLSFVLNVERFRYVQIAASDRDASGTLSTCEIAVVPLT